MFAARREAGSGIAAGTARLIVSALAGEAYDAEARLAATLRYADGASDVARAIGCKRVAGTPRFVAELGGHADPAARDSVVVAYSGGCERTLEDELAAGAALAPARVGAIVERVTAALAALHDQGVAHGLLRADLIGADPEHPGPLLEGFGVAQLAGSLAGPAAAQELLPPEYRGPELSDRASRAGGAAADVFALGVVVLEVLTGVRAAHGSGARDVAALSSTRVRGLLAAALDDNPALRPLSIGVWGRELGQALRELDREPETERTSEPAPLHEALPEPALGAPSRPPTLGPPAPAPAPVPARPNAASLAILISLGLSGLLMCGGVGGLFALGVRSASLGGAASVSSTAATAAPTSPAPPTALPAPSASSGETEAEAEAPPARARSPRTRPGAAASASFYPQDARAVLPLDANVPAWGSRDAPVTALLFGDLECPHTRAALGTLFELKSAFDDELRITFRHRPLKSHTHAARAAAVAAALHAELGPRPFWTFLELLAASSAPPSEEQLSSWLQAAGVSSAHVQRWLKREAPGARVQSDLEIAGRYDVRSTPTLFINGIRVEGARPFSELNQIVASERKLALAALGAGVKPPELYAERTAKNFINVGLEIAPRSCPAVAGSPARGSSDALVTIVEFSDFECEYCRQVQPTLGKLLARYGSAVRLVWKSFPLEQHESARAAAGLAMAVFEQHGEPAFWTFHDALFRAPQLDEAALQRLAKSARLDASSARKALGAADHHARVQRDLSLAEQHGVEGTPTFFVNGRRIAGAQPAAQFQKLIEEELSAARRLLKSGTPRARVYDALCSGS